MPFNTASCLNACLARPHLPATARLCQLCHFPLEISDHLLDWMRSRTGLDAWIQPEPLAELRRMEREERLEHLGLFWQTLRVERTLTLDSHTRNGCEAADFNREIPGPGTFDWVENAGVTEHIFDQRAVFASIHNLCRPGGIMTHKIPVYGAFNITLYGISPRFLTDLADANGYTLLSLGVANRWGDFVPARIPATPAAPPFASPLPLAAGIHRSLGLRGRLDRCHWPGPLAWPGWRLPRSLDLEDFRRKAILHPGPRQHSPLAHALRVLHERAARFQPGNPGELYTCAVLQKNGDTPFQSPYQGNNLKDIEPEAMRRAYARQAAANPASL